MWNGALLQSGARLAATQEAVSGKRARTAHAAKSEIDDGLPQQSLFQIEQRKWIVFLRCHIRVHVRCPSLLISELEFAFNKSYLQ